MCLGKTFVLDAEEVFLGIRP